MAITFSNRIGYTRKRLARMLEKAIPDSTFDPSDLSSQIPVYASAKWDCCSWSGQGTVKGQMVSIASWDTMRACTHGFTVSKDDGRGYADYEIHATKGQNHVDL